MIIELIFYALDQILYLFTFWLPGYGDVPLKLPWGTDDYIVAGVNGFKYLATYFPPFTTVAGAMVIYLGFKLIMRLMRAIPILGKTID